MNELCFKNSIISVVSRNLTVSDPETFACEFHYSTHRENVILAYDDGPLIEGVCQMTFDAIEYMLTPYWMDRTEHTKSSTGGFVFPGRTTTRTILRCPADSDTTMFFLGLSDKIIDAMNDYTLDKASYCVDIIVETDDKLLNCVSCFPSSVDYIGEHAYIELQADWVN